MNIYTIVLISLTLFSNATLATGLNIDFGSLYQGLPANYAAASGQTGAWNNITSSLTTLSNLNGASTATTLELSAGTINGANGTTPISNDQVLLYDHFHSPLGVSWSVEFSGLSVGLYNIFYYASGHESVSTGGFSINGQLINSLPGAASLIQGTSWDILENVNIENTGVLTIQSEDNNNIRGLSGLQIVPVATVPVVPAFWLFLFALFSLGIRKPYIYR